MTPPAETEPLADPFYPDPDWARLPPPEHSWTLTEIKSGVEVQTIDLSKRPCWLLGRAADQVHIPLAHESISRCHARIAFDASGTPWLRDCKSTHGTFVNKKKLPPQAVGTHETNSTKAGSRGVVLHAGDVLQFGASSRIYCLEGPEEFRRGAVQKVVPQVGQKPKQPLSITQPQQPLVDPSSTTRSDDPAKESKDDDGVSWGISMEDDDNDNAQSAEQSEAERLARQQILEDGSNIPDKHRKAWEKIAALKYKLKNVLLESERIRKKGDLTQGQEHQLKRNHEREQQLQENIVDRERDLYDKLFPDQAGSRNKSKKRSSQAIDSDEEEDDFFDRTKDNPSKANVDMGDAETEESLIQKWNYLKQLLQRKEMAADRAKQRVINTQEKLELLQSAGDEEAFFVQNDLKLAEEQHQKMQKEMEQVIHDMDEAKKLLKIVNSSIRLEDVPAATPEKSALAMAPPPGRKIISEPSSAADGGAVMPPPVQKSLPQETATATSAGDTDFMMPPPKRKRTNEAAPPDDIVDTRSPAAASEDEQKPAYSSENNDNLRPTKAPIAKGPVKGPAKGPPNIGPTMGGTLAALQTAASGSADAKHSRESAGNKKHNLEQTENSVSQKKKPTTIDLKNLQEDTWQAPKDQDGSGFTKLNEKFAGRY